MEEEDILSYLENHEEIADSGQFAAERGLDHDKVVNVIKSLRGYRFIDAEDIKRETWVLTGEGKTYALGGSPEMQLFLAIPPEGMSREELQRKLDPSVFKIGCSLAAKNKWVDMGKQISIKVQQVEDRVKNVLILIKDGKTPEPEDVKVLKSRKLIAPQ